VVVVMKIFEIEHNGDLQVVWKDCYQHPDNQKIMQVHSGQMVVVMSEQEFQRFKQRL